MAKKPEKLPPVPDMKPMIKSGKIVYSCFDGVSYLSWDDLTNAADRWQFAMIAAAACRIKANELKGGPPWALWRNEDAWLTIARREARKIKKEAKGNESK